MIEKKNTVLSIAVALALTACGGSDSTPAPAASTTSAKAVDGYLSGASALCDTNKNGVADAGEAVVPTGSQGDFTFSAACASTIVVSGGTNIIDSTNIDTWLAFKGVLKAPAGSTVATPLTTLMADTGLTAAQVAAFVGLPAGTDVSTLDPAAKNTDGSLKNADLQKKTLAVQQIIQQTANTLATLAQDTTATSIQSIYSEVVKAVAAALAANPAAILVGTSGTVSAALVTGIVQQSVSNVASSSNTALATVKKNIASYSKTSVAEVAAAAIAAQAESLTKSGDSNALITLTKLLQSDVSIANTVNRIALLLTTAQDSKVDLSALGAALKDLTTANTAGDAVATAAAQARAVDQVAAQAANAGVAVTLDPGTLNNPTNYLSILNDQITLNGTAYTLGQFSSGLTVTGAAQAALDTVGMAFAVNGTPVPADANGVKAATVSLGLELTDTGTSGRVLQVTIDTVNIAVDAGNKISVAVPPGAKAYVYGKTSSGASANLTLTNLAANAISADANNALSFNLGAVFTHALSGIQTPATAQLFSGLQNAKGTFNVKFVVSTLDVRKQDGTPAAGLSVAVTGSGQPPVSGVGAQGIVTVQ